MIGSWLWDGEREREQEPELEKERRIEDGLHKRSEDRKLPDQSINQYALTRDDLPLEPSYALLLLLTKEKKWPTTPHHSEIDAKNKGSDANAHGFARPTLH